MFIVTEYAALSQALYPLLSTSSNQVDLPQHNWKVVDLGIKNQNKQNWLTT